MSLEAVAAALETRLPGRVERDAPSAPLVTYRCGGPLAVLVRATSPDDLVAIAAELTAETDVLVVGRGSNLLVADRGFDGVAITLTGTFEQVDISGDTVDAGGAVALPVLARRSAAAGLAGLEFFVGIPGSVGGAVRMNAGGHGADTSEVIRSARVVELDTATVRTLTAGELDFGFRRSAIGRRDVVTGAVFAATPEDPDACGARIDEIVRWRREHQPGGQNAGSVFKNPPGDAAGRLVEASGAKGLRVGGAVVSEKHANFFVAEPGARAADVFALVQEVRALVESRQGVRLEPELKLVGFGCDKEAWS
jgi:UDP-N-acetylmuramate dehydrogenase